MKHLRDPTVRWRYGLVVIGLGCTFQGHAQTINWTGGAGAGNSFWDLTANWSAGIPGSANTAAIGSTFDPIYRSGTSTISSLQDKGSLTINGGSVGVSSTSFISGTLF